MTQIVRNSLRITNESSSIPWRLCTFGPTYEEWTFEFSTQRGQDGAFFIESEGVHLAELTYVRTAPDLVVINHTHVHPGLRHLGVARRLVDAAVAWARNTKTRVRVSCSYVEAQFEHDASLRDVLA